MVNLFRHIIGYTIGILLFAILIPYGLIELSKVDPVYKTDLNQFLLIRIIISIPFSVVGLLFIIWSNLSLFVTGKGGPTDGFNFAISPRTKHLVTNGPYRYCRNPMVFGAVCLYFSVGLFMLSVTSLVTVAVFLAGMAKYLKLTEEKRLLKDFGDEYVEYKKKTPLLIPDKLNIK